MQNARTPARRNIVRAKRMLFSFLTFLQHKNTSRARCNNQLQRLAVNSEHANTGGYFRLVTLLVRSAACSTTRSLPSTDEAGRVLISTNVPIVDKGSCICTSAKNESSAFFLTPYHPVPEVRPDLVTNIEGIALFSLAFGSIGRGASGRLNLLIWNCNIY